MTTEEIRMLTKNELVAEYERTIKWYKEHNINRNFSKYAEMFWILFDDGANSYMWAIDTICSWFPECDKEKLDKELLDVFRNKLQKLGYYIHIGEGKRNTYNYSIEIQRKDRYGIIQGVYVAEIERAQIVTWMDGFLSAIEFRNELNL